PGPRGVELPGGAEHLEPLGVEVRRAVSGYLPEPFPLAVIPEDGQLRLRGADRQLLALELDPRGENRVLERVLAFRKLSRDHPCLTRLAQAIQALAIGVVARVLFGRSECLQLLAAEQIPVTSNDLRPLRDLLLAHSDGPAFL